ncbi:MAG: YraN family protein [Rhodospirillales bacterium]|nr:YraN family protein [Rhodospirillales bacterium]
MAPTAKPAKQKAWRLGHVAELFATWRLRLKGYRIITRRFRSRVGEIDIIARRGDVLVFIEVKARRDAATAAHAISARQKRRITRTAQVFVQAHPSLALMDQRFDAILVSPRRWPVHLVDAWRPGL